MPLDVVVGFLLLVLTVMFLAWIVRFREGGAGPFYRQRSDGEWPRGVQEEDRDRPWGDASARAPLYPNSRDPRG